MSKYGIHLPFNAIRQKEGGRSDGGVLMVRKVRKIRGNPRRKPAPKGNFIRAYRSYSLSEEVVFEDDFAGIAKADLDVLKNPGEIKITRKAWISHMNKRGHLTAFEEISEVLNDPDLILHQRRKFGGNNVQFILKDVKKEKPKLVVVFTNEDGIHYVASAYRIERSKVGRYVQNHQVVYQR